MHACVSPFVMSPIPETIDKHLCGVCHWPDGTAVISSSALAGKYWSGSVWCYRDATDVPDVTKCITGVETESGICDIVPLGQNKLLIGLDSGGVEILVKETDPEILRSEFYSNEHDDLVVSVDVAHDLSKGISGSYDMGIKVWCLESLASINTYRPAHNMLIQCVLCSSTDADIFLSCGMDQKVVVWDLRLPSPASLLGGKSQAYAATALAWQPGNSSTVAVGDETGEIVLFDLRQNVRHTGKLKAHDRRVHRLRFSPSKPNMIASCADETEVIVSDVAQESPQVVYRKSLHEGFVRDLSWHPATNKLYSCGWDTRICLHALDEES